MNHTQLIVNIYHKNEADYYTVRDDQSRRVIGFSTIQQLDQWLKLSGGEFASGPKETEAGYYREIKIATWAYRQLMSQSLQKAA